MGWDAVKEYSNLTVTVGYEEVRMLEDTLWVQTDEKGNVKQFTVIVTERDGVRTLGRGGENMQRV